jgi:ABC-type branched-subunit amino acid transport system substrate-binding protein
MKYFWAAVAAILWGSSSNAKVHSRPTPRIAVILPTDESNFNAVGNVLNCMVRAVFESWKQRGFEFEAEFFNDRRDAMQAATVAEVITKKQFDVAIGTTLSSQALIVSKILDKNGIPFVAPLATHPDVVRG